MHILNDFFLLNWQEDAKTLFSSIHDIDSHLEGFWKSEYEVFCDYVAIIFVCDPTNIEKFAELQTPKNAIKVLSGAYEVEKKRVQYIQKELLFFLKEKGDLSLNKSIQKRIELLRKEEIIGYEKARKLISLLSLIEEKKVQQETKIEVQKEQNLNFYQHSISLIEEFIQDLSSLFDSKQKLEEIPQRIKKQEFSIGVTGVMNAGKSTMLNALLGEEILGTSVVPETANLTLLKYSKEQKAFVKFWDKSEWAKIEKNAQEDSSLEKFVAETKEFFKDEFENYIREDGYVMEIPSNALANFTSAKHSQKKCNLVSSVELYSDLKFLKDGVCIVDTPGLDDPVVQREEITKEYLSRCDLMIHLMNVNQSATAKDVEFIVDTLLYQNVSRLLLVITRIDSVKHQELEEVITYTKSAIFNRLKGLNKEGSFDAIISKLDFIPIASKMALLCRLGREEEAHKLGYDLEKSGILKIERYLEEVLFGADSQKVKIILASATKELLLAVSSHKELFEKQKELLGKSTQELYVLLENFQAQIKQKQKFLQKLKIQVENAKEDLKGHFGVLKNVAKNRFTQLQGVLKRRIVDDVSYEQRKNKKTPESSRVETMIDTGVKDGLIDLLRDYRYGFTKKMQEIFESFEREYEDISLEDFSLLDSVAFFQNILGKSLLFKSTKQLTSAVNTQINNHAKKDIELLDTNLEKLFGLFFDDIMQAFEKKSEQINEAMYAEFEKELNSLQDSLTKSVQEEEQMLHQTIKELEDSDFDKEKKLQELEEKIKKLLQIQEKILKLRSQSE